MIGLIFQHVAGSLVWYGIRASGIVSAVLLTFIVLLGIGQVTGWTYRFVEPIKAWAIHRAMALALVAGIATHICLVLFDLRFPFTLPQVLIPFLSTYNNGTTLLGLPLGIFAITFGILAMYGITLIVLTSLGWIENKKGPWQKVHYLSYPVALFVVLHVLYTGTDTRNGWFRLLWIIILILILVGIFFRLRRRGNLEKTRMSQSQVSSQFHM